MPTYEEYTAAIGTYPQMIGVVTRPAHAERPRDSRAVVLLGAGLVHHVGPNRLAVRLARRLATLGLACLRFDHRGVGDSSSGIDGRPFNASAVEEAREAMDFLERREGLRSFVLLGICSGADTALHAARKDSRVVGIGMINGGGQGVETAWDAYEYARKQVQYYLREAIFNADSWRRALTGRAQYRLLVGALLLRIRDRFAPPAQIVGAASATGHDVEQLVARGVQVLWIFSERDATRNYFETMFGRDADGLVASDRVRLTSIPYVDHTLTARHGQERFLDIVEHWLNGFGNMVDVSAIPRMVVR